MKPITAAVYGGGPFYSGGETVIDDLKGSGFTTVIAWCIHVYANGDLVYNDPPPIVSGGRYVGDPAWPARLARLKQGGSVNRLVLSVGSGGVDDFHKIKSLIDAQGSGPDSILYRNFKALKDAIPSIDAIDLDDEDLWDRTTTVTFSLMLNRIGYGMMFCPYCCQDFWIDCLYDLNSKISGLVTGFNLQCYSGGGGNDPAGWIAAIQKRMGSMVNAKEFVIPGLWSRHGNGCDEGLCPDEIADRFAAWKPDGIRGGFIWLYDDIQKCKSSATCPGPMDAKTYAGAIAKGLSESGRRST